MSDGRTIEKLKALKPRFSQMGLKRVRVFGSVARGDERPDSDLDLLLEFDGNPTLFDIMDVQQEIEKNVGRKVDIVTPGALHAALKDRILREARDV